MCGCDEPDSNLGPCLDLDHLDLGFESPDKHERETERPRRGGARLGNLAAARGAAASSRDDRLVPADFVDKTSG